MLLLCAVLGIQCSKDPEEPIEIIRPGSEDIAEDIDDPPAVVVGTPVENPPFVFQAEWGFSNTPNSTLIVNSITDFQVTEGYEFLYDAFLGISGEVPAFTSNTTEVFLDYENQAVYIFDPYYGNRFDLPQNRLQQSLLFYTSVYDWGWGVNITRFLFSWDLKLEVLEESGVEKEIAISGKGYGSHLPNCLEDLPEGFDEGFFDRREREITFEFKGFPKEGTNDFEGTFSFIENAPGLPCMLICSGTMTLDRTETLVRD